MIAKAANVQKYCGLNKDDLMNSNALRMVVLQAMRENLSYFTSRLEAFLSALYSKRCILRHQCPLDSYIELELRIRIIS